MNEEDKIKKSVEDMATFVTESAARRESPFSAAGLAKLREHMEKQGKILDSVNAAKDGFDYVEIRDRALDGLIQQVGVPSDVLGQRITDTAAMYGVPPERVVFHHDIPEVHRHYSDASPHESVERGLNAVIGKMSEEDILKFLIRKMDRHATPAELQNAMDAIYQSTTSKFSDQEEYEVFYDERTADGSFERLISMLEGIPSVKKCTLISEDIETATISIRTDTNRLNSDEIVECTSLISTVIEDYKPKGINRLEVIFHTTEIF